MKTHPPVACINGEHIQGSDTVEFQCPTCENYIIVSNKRHSVPWCDGTGYDPDRVPTSVSRRLYEYVLVRLLLWIVPKLFTFVLVYKPKGVVRAIHLAIHKGAFINSIKDYETRSSQSTVHSGKH